MLPEQQRNAFASFYQSARHNGELDAKTNLLMHLTAAMALGCHP